MVASPRRPHAAVRSTRHAGSAFQEAAAREVTRLHEARESPWWVEGLGVPVPVAGGFEAVDVFLRSPRAIMALQCLRVTPFPTLRLQQRPGLAAAGNLFTTVREIRHSPRGDTDIRECPPLHAAAMRALRGASGLADPQAGPLGVTPSRRAIAAVLTMARLVPERRQPALETRSEVDDGHDGMAERFWVWLLAGTSDAGGRTQRHPVAIVTWTGLRHFLSVDAMEPQSFRSA